MRKGLKEARQKAGMTQKQVAEYIGMIEGVRYQLFHRDRRCTDGDI